MEQNKSKEGLWYSSGLELWEEMPDRFVICQNWMDRAESK